MPIVPEQLPDAALKELRSVLTIEILRGVYPGLDRTDELSLCFPHRVGTIPLDSIRSGRSLKDIARIDEENLRILVRRRRGKSSDIDPIAAVSVTGQDGGFHLGEVESGGLVKGTEDAIRSAESMNAVRAGNYKAKLVLASALYVTSLWLEDLHGNDDILIPLPGPVTPLRDFKPLSSRGFVEALVPHAVRMRTMR